jgi:hypothetical protein
VAGEVVTSETPPPDSGESAGPVAAAFVPKPEGGQAQGDGLAARDPDVDSFDLAAPATGLSTWLGTPFGFWASWLAVIIGAVVLAGTVRWFVARRQ